MMERIQFAVSELRSAWRYRWHAVLAIWVTAALGWVTVLLIPNQYQSTARVFIDTNSMLRPLLDGIAVGAGSASQADLVRAALLNREQLGEVIDNTALKYRARNEREREDLLRDMTTDITVDSEASSPQMRQANMYSITYRDTDAELSYEVVQTLLRAFLTDSVGANRKDAGVAQEFLRDQIAAYENRLTESETRLAEFKKQNIGAMPDERGGYFVRLQSETTKLDQLRSQLAVVQNRRDNLQHRIVGGASSDALPSVFETSVDARIRAETARLEELLIRFTDAHPDVLAVRSSLARMEEQRRAELSALRSNSVSAGRPTAGSTNLVAQNLQISLNEAETELSSLRAQVEGSQRLVSMLRQQMNVLPGVEAELAKLNRDYDVTKAEYERLLQRFESAKLTDAADRIDEVKFKVIEPPVKSTLPVAPRRVILLLGVALAALAVGAAVSWLLSQMHPVFVRAKDVQQKLGLQLAASVSVVSNVNTARWPDLVAVSLAIAVIFIALGLLLAFRVQIEILLS